MKIIRLEPNPSGGYPPVQDWSGHAPPEGYATIPDGFDLATYYAASGFVTLTVTDGVLTSLTANQTAKDANDAAYPVVGSISTVPTHAIEDRVSALEDAVDYILMGGNT